MADIKFYLESVGVQVVHDDGDELACLCPFHVNTDSPAFYINKKTGLWICFNPACGKRGSMRELREFFGDRGGIVEDYNISDIEKNLLFCEPERQSENWSAALDTIKLDIETMDKAQYFLDRGLSSQTLLYFEIGFSSKRKRIVIPCRDEYSNLVGLIGRSVDPDVQPKYLYSKYFPRKNVLFNLNHAKMYESAIVVEGSVDAMSVHQAGFPNVVATLGATVTKEHTALLRRYFNKIIIFGDNDEAGRSMMDIIINECNSLELSVVRYPGPEVKDPGDMSEEQIVQAVGEAENFIGLAVRDAGSAVV